MSGLSAGQNLVLEHYPPPTGPDPDSATNRSRYRFSVTGLTPQPFIRGNARETPRPVYAGGNLENDPSYPKGREAHNSLIEVPQHSTRDTTA